MTSPAQQARLPSAGAPGKPGKVNNIYHYCKFTFSYIFVHNFLVHIKFNDLLIRGKVCLYT